MLTTGATERPGLLYMNRISFLPFLSAEMLLQLECIHHLNSRQQPFHGLIISEHIDSNLNPQIPSPHECIGIMLTNAEVANQNFTLSTSSITVKVEHPAIKRLNNKHRHKVDIFPQWTAVPCVHFILSSLGEVFHLYMRRCREPLGQMKAIVGFALWSLCDAYLLFWWNYCDHLTMFSSLGSATAKLVLHRGKAPLYRRNWFLNVTVFWDVWLMTYHVCLSFLFAVRWRRNKSGRIHLQSAFHDRATSFTVRSM